MNKLEELLKFVNITNEFQKITRNIYVKDTDRKENDAEHSYQLAMLAWYILDLEKNTQLNRDLIIKYALIHDFVEVYAGDTYIYTKDQEHKAGKQLREKDAADRLNKELSEFKEFNVLITNYNKKTDSESKFIYALDKLVPILNIYTDKGRTWKINNVTLDMIIETKQDKIAVSPEIKPYFDEIIRILMEKEDIMFHV